ncbi:DUF4159 domain-containing protein [Nitrospirillum pindoramense]|uniref:Putative membrane protein (TIGR02226 family) n=1 Tax=Nitrospirillum amazonense TaxID=28077 RepID=A0A560HJ59_9PROT|nr:DUF4159 domain-containing protein [Nitrospirillum amazonense]TWB45260.1 putative membrane protein (TIGR02226 family) [Nitrospirillum amazonense]
MAFASPLVLWALILLPGLWWLLRLTPPAPKRVTFPALRLLLGLTAKEETPARTPWWLLVLRLALGALLIVGLARPLLHPDAAPAPGSAPMLLVVDTGWAAGRDWPERQQALDRLVTQAERQDRPVLLLPTAAGADGQAPQVQGPMSATAARRLVQALAPQPWPSDRAAALAALDTAQKTGPLAGLAADSYWLADGLNDGSVAAMAGRLRALGRVTVLTAGADHSPLLLRAPNSDARTDGGALMVPVERAEGAQAQPIAVEALGEDGRALGRSEGVFAPGERQLTLPLTLPGELRNAAVRLHLEERTGVGASLLLDDRWRRRPVGLATAGPGGDSQPLLSSLYYLDRALAPYAEVRRGTIRALLEGGVSVLVLPDTGALSDSDTDRVSRWIDQGGVLVRFGGTRLAHEQEPIGAETLLPVRLRGGDRSLGGALSWTTPAHLSPFDDKSPFAGLEVPPDVTVSRQVLAEPGPDLGDKVWARLEDGTPLVTGERRGKGWLVLVHTSADPAWSNLALSGLYVDMLRRLVALSDGLPGGIGGNAGGALPPLMLLDGQGRLVAPSALAQPLEPEGKDGMEVQVGPLHPPGYYGVGDRRRALNLAGAVAPLVPMPTLAGVTYQGFGGMRETDLRPWFLGVAAALWVADLFLSLFVRGLLPTSLRPSPGRNWRRGATAAALALATVLAAPRGHAATPDSEIVKATTANWLAYVETGDRTADATTKAGLLGLGEQLNRRTAVEVAGAMSVNVEKDDLALFPLLYWVVTPGQPSLSDAAVAKLNQYLHAGGMILFDTRDQGAPDSAVQARLRDLTHGLDVPPLAPVGPDHVLSRTFFLMQDFPGRQAGGQVWAEASEGRVNDGVSPVLVGGNDWAGAWAIDGQGRPLNAVVPGGERQREMAYRFGINLVMYALTGNYKADQVHVPAILERLGQ